MNTFLQCQKPAPLRRHFLEQFERRPVSKVRQWKSRLTTFRSGFILRGACGAALRGGTVPGSAAVKRQFRARWFLAVVVLRSANLVRICNGTVEACLVHATVGKPPKPVCEILS